MLVWPAVQQLRSGSYREGLRRGLPADRPAYPHQAMARLRRVLAIATASVSLTHLAEGWLSRPMRGCRDQELLILRAVHFV